MRRVLSFHLCVFLGMELKLAQQGLHLLSQSQGGPFWDTKAAKTAAGKHKMPPLGFLQKMCCL